jgi:hypothetical protein
MTGFRRWALGAGLVVLGLAGLPAAPSLSAQTAGDPPAGNGTFYVGAYKGAIVMLDEATGNVVGEIPLKTGIPGFALTLSADRSRIYVVDATSEKVEIIDRERRATIDAFTLSEGSTKTRIWNLTPDPSDRYVILSIKNYTLKTDRWEIGPPTLVQVDLATRKITRTIPWPKGEEREGAGVLFSPDGSLMYLLGEDILIYETENFTEVDRWDLSRPIEMGAGRVSFGGLDPSSDEPGFFTGLLTMQDPLQNRRIMGLGRIDLAGKKIDFRPIGPARGMRFTMSPDRKHGYGLSQDIGDYELWTFDLENYKLLSRTPFKGRPRMSIRASSSGELLYIYMAGNTIDVYEADPFRYVRTIMLDTDMTSLVLVPPAPAGGRD